MSHAPGWRVVVAEDSALLLEMLVATLTRFGFTVPATATHPDELLQAVTDHTPDAVLTDVRMPPGFRDEGLRAAIQLRRQQPDLPILVLSQYVEHDYARRLLAEDPRGIGYLLKDRVTNVRSLIDTLHQVLHGGTVIDPDVVQHLLARRHNPLDRLTAREHQTLDLMAQGRSNAAIAHHLLISEATVAKHVRALFDKLDLALAADDHRRVLAVLTYLHHG